MLVTVIEPISLTVSQEIKHKNNKFQKSSSLKIFHYEDVMISIKEKFIVDEKGNKTGVVLPIEDYEKLLNELEDIEDIKAYDNAKMKNDEVLPFENAMNEIGL